MRRRQCVTGYSRILISCAMLLCMVFLCGFTLPSSHELRREFQAELKKIKEKAPGARARADWIRAREAAQKAISEALINGAPEYAREEWDEAADLLERARRYSLDGSYRKAAYLARKSRETAESASDHADKAREKIEKDIVRQLNIFKKKLDMIRAVLPDNSEWTVPLADLFLQWSDIKHCISLGLYHEAKSELNLLDKGIRKFRKESGIKVDNESEKWEETI